MPAYGLRKILYPYMNFSKLDVEAKMIPGTRAYPPNTAANHPSANIELSRHHACHIIGKAYGIGRHIAGNLDRKPNRQTYDCSKSSAWICVPRWYNGERMSLVGAIYAFDAPVHMMPKWDIKTFKAGMIGNCHHWAPGVLLNPEKLETFTASVEYPPVTEVMVLEQPCARTASHCRRNDEDPSPAATSVGLDTTPDCHSQYHWCNGYFLGHEHILELVCWNHQ